MFGVAHIALAQELTLKQIRQGYLDNISRIVTADVRYRTISNDPRLKSTSVPNPETEVHWISSGRKYFYSGTPMDITTFPLSMGFGNGAKSWHCDFARGTKEPTAVVLTEQNKDSAERSFMTYRFSTGLGGAMGLGLADHRPNSLTHLTLADLMASDQCFIREARELFGHQCIVVESLNWHPSGEQAQISFEFTLDTETGFMPRSIVTKAMPANPGSKVVAPRVVQEYETPEMQLVSTPIGDVWYPQTVRQYFHFRDERRLTSTAEVIECQLNHPVPGTTFVPRFPPSVNVVSTKDKASLHASRETLTALKKDVFERYGPSPFDEFHAEQRDRSSSATLIVAGETLPAGDGVSAIPHNGTPWSLILGILGASVIAVSLFLRARA